MNQNCQVYINIETNTKEEKEVISNYLKKTFETRINTYLYNSPLEIEIVDDMPTLIVLDINIEYELYYVAGSPTTRYEPGEPGYFEDVLTKEDFYTWIYIILKRGHFNFDYDIDIDEDSYIPDEERLLEDYYEEVMYEEY